MLSHLANSTSSFRTQMTSLPLRSIITSNVDALTSVFPEYTKTFTEYLFINFHAATEVSIVPGAYEALNKDLKNYGVPEI